MNIISILEEFKILLFYVYFQITLSEEEKWNFEK
jgi:hypothetical protein